MTQLRKDALAVLRAGIRAIRTEDAVARACRLSGDLLTIGKKRFDLRNFRRVFVIGIGKASLDAAKALETILGDRITDGIVLDVRSAKLRRIRSLAGTHPLPSMANTRATGEIIGLLKQVDSRDLVVTVVSGGGSTLLCWPYDLKCDDMAALTSELMRRGATIQEVNTVRKHTSEVLGGQFARLAYPATLVGLIFSDVPGDGLDVIASGPTVMDTTTVPDAERVMAKYDLLRACRLPNCDLRETPKDPALFRHVTNVLVVSNRVALDAMARAAKERGYRCRIGDVALVGEAREVGRALAETPVRAGEMILYGGETTVTVRGNGKGGRNQELVLGALAYVVDDGIVLSCASDGIDNSPVAGAIADAETRRKAAALRLSPDKYLAKNDSLPFFEKAGGQIVTGPTGANVSDLMLVARAKRGTGT